MKKQLINIFLFIAMALSFMMAAVGFTTGYAVDTEKQSLLLQAGNLVAGTPAYVTDTNVTKGKLTNYPGLYEPYGVVEHPAAGTIKDTEYPEFDMGEKDIIKAKNILFSFHVGDLVANDFDTFNMTFCWTDWNFGNHKFYLYKSGTSTFLNDKGQPAGYLADAVAVSPNGMLNVKISDVSKLADSTGHITDVFILYGGNTKDTETEIFGTWNGTQLWVNEVNFNVRKELKTENFLAGDIPGTVKPDYVTDKNVTYVPVEKAEKNEPYGYTLSNAKALLDETTLAGVETYKNADDASMLRAKNILFSLSPEGKLSKEFTNFYMSFFFNDTSKGTHKFYLYPSGTKTFLDKDGKPANYVAEVVSSGADKKIEFVVDDIKKLADSKGVIDDIFILYNGNTLDTKDETVGTAVGTELWINEVNFIYELRSIRMEGGLTFMDKPFYVNDDRFTFGPNFNHKEKYMPVGYVDNPSFTTINEKFFPGVKTEGSGTTKSVIVNKLAFAYDMGGVDIKNYSQFQMTFCWTDWNHWEHQFYLYPTGTEVFADEDGNPTGYVAKIKTSKPETRYKFEINDLSLLANERGIVNEVILVYWGNTFDTPENIKGTWYGTQLWVNEINFLIEEDVAKPVISEQFISKDISEVMPVGSGWTTEVKSVVSGEQDENYGKNVVAGALKTQSFDRLTFTLTPKTDGGKFSTMIIIKADSPKEAWAESGIVFWFADTDIGLGAGSMLTSKKRAELPAGVLVDGHPTIFTISAIPYYLEGVHGGYYVAIYANNQEEPILDMMLSLSDTVIGRYTKIINQDFGNDYTVEYGPESSVVKTADEIMNVKISANKEVYNKPRAAIDISHLKVEGETVSDVVVVGPATYSSESGTLKFDKEGKVTLYYTVTNAFGTFKSNELVIKYDDGKGCGGTIEGSLIFSGAMLLVATAVMVLRKKKD